LLVNISQCIIVFHALVTAINNIPVFNIKFPNELESNDVFVKQNQTKLGSLHQYPTQSATVDLMIVITLHHSVEIHFHMKVFF